MQHLINFDKAFFKLINGVWTNSFFDWLMPWVRNPELWVPLYLFLILLITINFKKQAGWILFFAVLTVTLTDTISSHIFKPYFHRLRPCSDPEMAGMVRLLLSYAPGNGSFTSSHAANHFGIAMFFYLTLKQYFGNWMFSFFAWAFIICYAQVYVGVHYPFDILGGAIIGCLSGYFTAWLLNRQLINTRKLSS